jgi:acyl-coenzyme A synthetase/AMP-(fatty) acid ligase
LNSITYSLLHKTTHTHNGVVAYRHGRSIHAHQFLHHVYTVAANLPSSKYCLNVCGDRYNIAVLLAAAMLANRVSLLPPNTAPATLKKLTSTYEAVITVTDDKEASHFADAIQFASLLAKPFIGETPNPHFAYDQIVGILFTSGSTGEPTPNIRYWGALCSGVMAEAIALGLPEITKTAQPLSILGTVPAQHSYGLESTLALALQNGHALCADHSFYPADITAALEKLPRPRALVTTPFHLRLLIESSDEAHTLPAVDLIVCATAPLSNQLAQNVERRFNAPVKEIYGCTEAGQMATRESTQTELWTLFPGVRLTQKGDITWAQDGHVGEARPLGDVIEQKSDTQFLLHGRTADLINIAGKRTSLAHLNFQLNSIAGVDDGIFVLPTANHNENIVRLTAYVVSKLTIETILYELRKRIDPIFLPRPVKLVSTIPRNVTGKVTQQSLLEMAAQSDTLY